MATTVPVYNTLILPDTTFYMVAKNYKELTNEEPAVGNRLIFLFKKKNINAEEYTPDSFQPLAVTGTISEVSDNGYIEVRTEARVEVESLSIQADHTVMVDSLIRKPYTEDEDPADSARRLEQMKNAVARALSSTPWSQIARSWIHQFDSIPQLVVMIGQWLNLSPEMKYQILAVNSRKAQTDMIEKAVYQYTEPTSVTNEAEQAQENDNQKAYREQAIRKQMEYLQQELDEMHPENITDVRRLQKKIEESGMNETARREADKVLSRMKQEGQNSPEYGNLYNYLDFMTSLSWKKAEMKPIDIGEAEKILNEDHYGLKKVKNRILQQIAVMDLNKKQSGSILLFVGAPGTGKTSIGRSIAKATHRPYVRVSLGGVRDEADIRGHRRTYIGAMPGRIMDGIAKAGASNPVMVLDEIDKLGVSYQGDPASALLEVLDPEQNNTFTDHYLNVPYDLSDVLFICTANTLDSIPGPLLDRMEIIEFTGYTAADKFQIAKRHLLPKAREKMGIRAKDMVISDAAIRTIISDYTAEGGVRGLQKCLETLCRSAAVEIARGGRGTLRITNANLRKYLDAKPMHHEHVLAQKKPGVVTGLAWTQAGGEILFIESLLTEGTGRVIITGQLGDVMKESVQIALSLVKAMFPKETEVLKDHDLHVHVPEGAVKKDGPSAGITLTTALASLFTGRPVSPEFAMTGEVSLRGNVMPIGGLPEKLMAAQRAGVKTVFIPKENVEDLEDVAEEVKQKLNIIPVNEVKDVLKAVGILPA
jgi:ATP-dependent Lon protease